MRTTERGEVVARYGRFRLHALYNLKLNMLMDNYEVVLEDDAQQDGELPVMLIPRDRSEQRSFRLLIESWYLYANRTLKHAQTETEKIRHEMSEEWYENCKKWEEEWKYRMQKVKEATEEIPYSLASIPTKKGLADKAGPFCQGAPKEINLHTLLRRRMPKAT